MTTEEKLSIMEEVMDVEPGSLHLEDNLNNFEEWDSLSVLSYISKIRDTFNKTITGKEVKEWITVADAIEKME